VWLWLWCWCDVERETKSRCVEGPRRDDIEELEERNRERGEGEGAEKKMRCERRDRARRRHKSHPNAISHAEKRVTDMIHVLTFGGSVSHVSPSRDTLR